MFRRILRIESHCAQRVENLLLALTLISLSAVTARGQDEDLESVFALEFLSTHCIECHQGSEAESGLHLEHYRDDLAITDNLRDWKRVLERVSDHSMPPSDAEPVPEEERDFFVGYLETKIFDAVCADGPTAGPARFRRMNRTEYANTVRDLLRIHVNAGDALPADGAGGEGFDNASEVLFISPIYAEKYLDAAKTALSHALTDPGARAAILVTVPDDRRSPEDAARSVMSSFLPRAFRRPVSDQEIEEYVKLFHSAYQLDESYESAIRFALEAAMVSPKFLLLHETPNDSDRPQKVTQHELASRLSYFLWTSMPDDELRTLADQGRLHDSDVLKEQIRRMLHSRIDRRGLRRGAKVREFCASFMEQWLGTRALGREFQPDPKVAPRYDSELEGGLKYEPIFFFEDILSENRSLLNFIDSDFTYINRGVARHYRIRGEFREQPKRVDLQPQHHRGGLLGMGAVLAVSSHPYRTSPVLRGKWILETLLGTPPPPPPPDVPALPESGTNIASLDLRAKLEAHRENAACATCHDRIDPLGFGLENYDILGRWRDDDDGQPIVTRGRLPDGSEFDGPDQLKQLLMDRKDLFIRHFTSKMLGFALSRELIDEDQCLIEEIAMKLADNEYKAQTLIEEIVLSVPFQYKAPRTLAETEEQ